MAAPESESHEIRVESRSMIRHDVPRQRTEKFDYTVVERAPRLVESGTFDSPEDDFECSVILRKRHYTLATLHL